VANIKKQFTLISLTTK